MLGGLRGWADDDGNGDITGRELITYTSNTMRAVVRGRTQTPEAYGPQLDRVLATGREGGPDLGKIVLSLKAADATQRSRKQEPRRSASDDISSLAAEALETRKAREEMGTALDDEIAVKADSVRNKATIEWNEIQPLTLVDGNLAQPIVEAYIAKYGDATVTVAGMTREIHVPEVESAKQWLSSHLSAPVGEWRLLERLGYRFQTIPAGTYHAGIEGSWQKGHCGGAATVSHEASREIEITKAFQIGETEVTQELFQEVMGSTPWTYSDCDGADRVYNGSHRPAICVSWRDAIEFCNKASTLDGLHPVYRIEGDIVSWNYFADGYRLPTEAEWAYAAAGSGTAQWTDLDDLPDYAWFGSNADGTIHPVGEKRPNRNGLYDTIGNVDEWVWDWYDPSRPREPVADPAGPPDGKLKIIRGGSHGNGYCGAQAVSRYWRVPDSQSAYIGFRIAQNSNE